MTKLNDMTTINSDAETMCEDCAGGGSKWQRTPSTKPFEIQRLCDESGSGKGKWVHCTECDGKGFVKLTSKPDDSKE